MRATPGRDGRGAAEKAAPSPLAAPAAASWAVSYPPVTGPGAAVDRTQVAAGGTARAAFMAAQAGGPKQVER